MKNIDTNFFFAGHGLVSKNNKILVLQRSDVTGYKPKKWDLPGGNVRPGEKIEETIIREFYEETNLNIKIRNVLHLYNNLSQLPERQTIQAIYFCELLQNN